MTKSENKQTSLRAFTIATLIGFALAIAFIAITAILMSLHKEWLKRGSPYDVEYEFLYSNIFRHIRESLYNKHLDSDNAVQRVILSWQEYETQKAFEKIPETDGERVLWQLSLDEDFWHKISNQQDISVVMPVAFKYFDKLVTMPMASQWAKNERLSAANRIAVFIVSNSKNPEVTQEQINNWQEVIMEKMDALIPEIDSEYMLNLPSYGNRIQPLLWNKTLLNVSWNTIQNTGTSSLNCKPYAIRIFLESEKRIRVLLKLYEPRVSDPYGLQWIKIISHDVDQDIPKAKSLIHDRCPHYIN